MAETKFINSKSFTATNTFRSAATITVLVFCLSAARGENLTTLDGRTFTNVVSVTNYSSVVVIRHDGGMTGVKPANLPEDFRAKYGIVIKTNAPVVAARSGRQLSPIDLFLWQNRESKLEQRANESLTTNLLSGGLNLGDLYKGWSITIRSAEVDLSLFTTKTFFEDGKIKDKIESTDEMTFDTGDEDSILKIFDKFLEWDNVATTNNAENFEKEIARRNPVKTYIISNQQIFGNDYPNGVCIYTFKREDKHSTLNVFQPDAHAGDFDGEDVIHFQSLLKQLPGMKEKLASAIRNKEVQKDLFK